MTDKPKKWTWGEWCNEFMNSGKYQGLEIGKPAFTANEPYIEWLESRISHLQELSEDSKEMGRHEAFTKYSSDTLESIKTIRKLEAENEKLKSKISIYKLAKDWDILDEKMRDKEKVEKLEARIEKLRACVEFYADKDSWLHVAENGEYVSKVGIMLDKDCGMSFNVTKTTDKGDKAREALAEDDKEREK